MVQLSALRILSLVFLDLLHPPVTLPFDLLLKLLHLLVVLLIGGLEGRGIIDSRLFKGGVARAGLAIVHER